MTSSAWPLSRSVCVRGFFLAPLSDYHSKPPKLWRMHNPDVKHKLNWAVELCSACIQLVTGHVNDGGVTTQHTDDVKLERFSVKNSETEMRLKTDGLCRGKEGKRGLAGIAWWLGVCWCWNTDRQVISGTNHKYIELLHVSRGCWHGYSVVVLFIW